MSATEQARTGRALKGRAGPPDDVRATNVRRSAWLFGLLAVAFYLGFIAWNFLRAPLGG
jgi:hypothetical protein